MVNRPRITVAFPTCDGARHLRAALASVRAQTGADFDVVVSDDRSQDETLALVREVFGDRASLSVNSERLGLAGNWNRCVALSQTPLVAVFHQDDVMRPGHLAAHLAAAEATPDLGLIASAVAMIDAAGRPVPSSVVEPGGCGPADRVFPPGEFVGELAASNPLRCSAVTVSAAAHAEAGGFDPSYRYVVDWDFWLKVARRWPVAWLARPTVAMRWHPASETHRFRTGTDDLDETVRLLDEIGDIHGSRHRANRRLARAFLNRAYVAVISQNPTLARRCLGRAVRLSPTILATIALDPRLAARLILGLGPRWGRISGE